MWLLSNYLFQNSRKDDYSLFSYELMKFINRLNYINSDLNILKRLIGTKKYIRLTNIFERKLKMFDDQEEIEEYIQCIIEDKYYVFRPSSRYNKMCLILWEGKITNYPFGLYRYNLKNGVVIFRNTTTGTWEISNSLDGEECPHWSITTSQILNNHHSYNFTIFKQHMSNWKRTRLKTNISEYVKYLSENKKRSKKWSISYYCNMLEQGQTEISIKSSLRAP